MESKPAHKSVDVILVATVGFLVILVSISIIAIDFDIHSIAHSLVRIADKLQN